MEDEVKRYLSRYTRSGYGNGSGPGAGYESGDGYGYRCEAEYGSENGSGSGDGDGSGYGSGSGNGITAFCGQAVHEIDGVQTLIDHIKGNAAKGRILMGDLTTCTCYIVRGGGMFAHGDTLRQAMDELQDKLYRMMDVEERIEAFLQAHKENVAYPARDLFAWHNRLTGSCEAGRKAFCADHGINLDEDNYTVAQFIALTRDAYGGKVIRKLEDTMMEREKQGT